MSYLAAAGFSESPETKQIDEQKARATSELIVGGAPIAQERAKAVNEYDAPARFAHEAHSEASSGNGEAPRSLQGVLPPGAERPH